MNEDRRARIAKLQEQLAALKSEVETIRDEEQETYDKMPDARRRSFRGQRVAESADALMMAYDYLNEAFELLRPLVQTHHPNR